VSVYRNKRVLEACRGFACGWCGRQDGTVVAAHYNGSRGGKGMGLKASDALVAALCFVCHQQCDQSHWMSGEERRELWSAAHARTRKWLLADEVATEDVVREWEAYDSRG